MDLIDRYIMMFLSNRSSGKDASNSKKKLWSESVEKYQEESDEVNHYSGKFQALQEANSKEENSDEEIDAEKIK